MEVVRCRVMKVNDVAGIKWLEFHEFHFTNEQPIWSCELAALKNDCDVPHFKRFPEEIHLLLETRKVKPIVRKVIM